MANYYRNRIEQKKRELEKKSGTSSQTSSTPKTLTSRDRIDKMRMESTIGFDTLQSDLDSLSSQYTSMYDGWQTQETMSNVTSSMKAMQDRLNLITEYADKYGMDGVKDLDVFKNELKNYNNSYAQALDSLRGQSKVYGQYKDASSYTKDKTEIDKLNSMTTDEVASYLKGKNPIAYTTQTGQDITWQSLYDEKRHKDVLKSGKVKEGWDKYLSDKSAKEETKKKEEDDEKWYEWLAKTVGGVSDSTLPSSGLSQVVNEKRKDDSYMHPTDEWTEDEQNIFGAYYIENPEEAYKYATKVNNDKNKAKKNEQKGEVVDSATSSFGAGALHTAGSLATAPLGLADYLDDLTDSVAGRPILEEAYLSPFEYSQTVQGGIGEYLNEYGTIAEDIPVLGGAGLGDIYGLGTSMAQSILSAYSLGSVGMGISYFGQGSASGVDEALERGATDDEALLYGASVGVPEGALEALTGHLLKGVGKGGGSIAKDILGQGGEEAFEEGLTSIIGQIADNVILKDKSAFNNAVRKYISQGMTEEEANAKAKQDVVEGVAYDTLAGFLSGAGSAGILAPINAHMENKALGTAIRENQNIDELKGIAEELGGDAYTDYLNMLNGEKVSDAKVGKFYRQVEGDVTSGYETSRANDIMRTVADRAIELGDSKNSGMIASAVQKTIDGKKLSAEEKAIMKSDTAQVIMEDIKRGEIASKKSESFKNASDLKERTENLLIPTSKVKATGEKISVEGVKKVDGETVIVTNNGEMSASDIDLAEHEAKLVDYTKGMNEEMANLFVSSYDGRSDIDSYKAQFDLAYSYGENEFGVSAILEKTRLNPSQASAIYTMAKDTKYATRQKAVNKLVKEHTSGKFVQGKVNESAIDYTNSGKGEVNWSDLSKTQQRHITFQNALYTGLGINVRWTTKGLEGNFNGQYSKDTNEITLDIYAGVNKHGEIKDADLAIMRTSSHEITHWMETKSPELYKGLKEHIFDSLKKVDGVDDATRIHAEMMSNPTVKTEEEAIAEIVARGCEDMLSMSDIGKEVLGKMTENEKKTFIGKVKEVFNEMIEFIDKLLGQFTSKSYEAQILRQNKESLEKQLALWEEALKNAVEVNQAMNENGITDKNIIESVEKVGISIDAETNSAYPSEVFSRRTWEESDYAQNREVAVKNLAKALGVSQKKAKKYIDDINSVARMIADDKARLDYEPNMDDSASVMKPNSDYKWSIDMSTLCAKRLLFTGTFDAIQRALPNKVFSSEDIVKLRKMMMDRAYEVACGICYVESTRREIGAITQQFIDNYKESQRTGKPITRTNSEGKVVDLKKTKEQMKTTVDKSSDRFIADKEYTPTLADLNTTDIDLVKRDHPMVYEAYLNFMNARGQAKPKLLETRAEYKGEIAKKYKRTKDGRVNQYAKDMNDSGGLRLQSFSDFEIAHLIDMMQIVMDMSNVGLYSQAYTKVPAFAEVFGGTGVKINLSLIAKGNGLDADGNLIFDDVEGIDHKEAFRLREKYSKNVGTILVGKNDEHIIKAMADQRIDYIIPFHKSSWKESLYDSLGLTGYADYTDTQHEKAIDGRKISDFKPSEYWDYSKSGDENAKIYLDKCKKDGRIPKFPQFQGYEGYWKLLIDFKMYDNDGVGSPQTEVMPEFDMDSAMQILNDYEGGHRNLPVAKDVVEDFVSEYTQYSRRDSDYMDAVNRGDMETAQKMVDEVAKENGYVTVVYHGTDAEKINVFVGSPNKMETNAPNLIKGYFSDQEAYSDGYGKNTFTYYINDANFLEIEGMYDADEMTEYLERHGVTDVKYNDFISNEDEIIDWFDSWGGEYRDDVIDPWFFFNENGGNITERIHEAGYKGVWWYEGDFSLDGGVAYMPFESSLIKSADPVVYDDDGNVIPLSKRFDSSDVDTRYARRYDNSFDFLKDKELIKKAKAVSKEQLRKHDERITKKTTIDRIQKNTKLLTAYLEKPTKDKHIPMELIEPVRNLLVSIDYATRNGGIDTSDQKDALAKVEKNVMEARKNVDLRANLTAFQMATSQDEMLQRAGVDFSGDIEALTKSLGNLDLKTGTVFVLKDMSLEDVARIDKIVRILKTVITRANYYGTLKRKITISASAHELFDLFDSLGEVKEGKLDGVKDFFNYDNVTPIWFFDRLGDVGKDLFQSFVKGQTRLAFNVAKAKEFAEGTKGKKGTKGAWTSEERKRWDEDLIEFEVVDAKKTRDITKPVMKKVYTTTSRLMTLYLHDQREQSRGHLYKGGGGRFTTFEHKGKTYGEDVNGVVLTPQLVKHMLSKLDPRAKEVADKISVYLNTVCKDLGNEVTRDLYDVELFLEPKYIPIEVIAESVSRRTEKSAPSITALLNKGFTKETKPNAKNQIVLDSIFDVYAKHTAEMITYNAYAREVYDAVRLFEYKENRQTYVFDGEEGQEVSDNIQTAMKGALGKGAVKYFRNFLEDVNGTQQAGRGNGFLGKAFSNSKLANVAWNMNVVLLQPFALIRAMITINPKYLGKGIFGIRSGMKSAMEHSGTALYKSFGYYDTDISLPFAEQIKNAETFGDKVKDWSMKGAEVMDKVTWGALWKACEYKVLAENKGLERGSDKFYDKVAEIFDETVYRTQVMDSTLSRSQNMRNKNDVMKGLTSFMAEPLLSYNTVYGVFSEWNQYSRQGHSVAKCSKKCGKKLAVAIGAYCLGSLAEAGVRTLTSAMRNAGNDDEEDENVFIKQLLDSLNPLSKIPVLKEFVSALQGYGVSAIPGLNTVEAFVNAYNTICKIIVDGDEVSYKKVHKLLKAVSYASGHGISNAYRDIIAIWNSTIGQMYPSLIIKTDE